MKLKKEKKCLQRLRTDTYNSFHEKYCCNLLDIRERLDCTQKLSPWMVNISVLRSSSSRNIHLLGLWPDGSGRLTGAVQQLYRGSNRIKFFCFKFEKNNDTEKL